MEASMIQSTIRMTIPPQKSGVVSKILKSVVDLCRDDVACFSCHLYEDQEEKNVFMLEEVWRAEGALNLHLLSDEYRNLLLVLEMALKQPEIRFATISNLRGIEIIEKARSRLK
jgi:quinol monooxygenase YgiN